MNYVAVWVDLTYRQRAQYFATKKKAKHSQLWVNVLTRKQFESLTTASERKSLLRT